MNILPQKTIERGQTPVVFLRPGERIHRHPLGRAFAKEDREFLGASLKRHSVKPDENRVMFMPKGEVALLIGIPEASKWNHRRAILGVRRAIDAARKARIDSLLMHLHDLEARDFRGDAAALAEVLGTQATIANFEFVSYKTAPKEGWFFVKNVYVHAEIGKGALARALERGRIIGEEINNSRSLANTPGGDMTPVKLAEAAVETGRRRGFRVTALDEREIKKLNMGGIIGVSKGSAERPRFIVMEYMKGKKKEQPIVLVGKGVTFDTGGLNLKPEQGIYEMHMDMSGGAATIHTMAALARLGEKRNVVGLVPAVENMPSGSSYHPGDLLRTARGTTIEVLNTDAEGRIILADALEYARSKYNPALVIDIATLTGAAVVALGQRASALFTNESKLERLLRDAGEWTGDFVWPLPLWEEYENDIKGTFGDVANTGKTRWGGAITGAAFLWQFVKGNQVSSVRRQEKKNSEKTLPWVHLDIAPRMTTVEGEFLAKGSAGAPIALLVHFIRKFGDWR